MSTSRNIVPCLWFDDQAEAAAEFYTRTFPNGRIVDTSHYPQATDNPGKKPRGSVLTVEFEIAGQRFTALNGGPDFTINPSISFFAFAESVAEVERLYAALLDGGSALMEIGSFPWSERYGWVKDRFGVSWQVMVGAQRASTLGGATIVPCLMFSDAQHGRAYEAMQHYADVFEGGRIVNVARYTAAEGPEGTIKHGRIEIAGQPLIAMDSHIKHDISFNEGLSLQIMCKTQREIDHFWSRLTEGGEPSVCGWLRDRFGVSWQVVPANIATWLSSKDTAARDRAFQAMMKMRKPDIAALEAAFNGSAGLSEATKG